MVGKKNRKRNGKDIDVHNTNNDELNEIDDEFQNVDKKSLKRQHAVSENADYDSDMVSKHKKPKKKNLPVSSDISEKKNKKSIRQMKREKHAERQAAAEAIAKDQLKSQCINYLSQWKHNRQNWKFMKAKQVWLFKNKFSSNLVPDTTWPILLEYFESAKGNIRNMLLADAHKVMKQMDDWTDSQNDANKTATENSQDSEVTKPDDIVYNRARSLIQCLEE